ncbi:MAG: CDP-alcohol phosphatidyltransferase family protein [Geminicoccaceae bacterium]|nr:CDP-alcohol phosphatidyltransferase family protein [Geminicoccaceae bacterium]
MAIARSGRPAGRGTTVSTALATAGRALLGQLANILTAGRLVSAGPLALLVLHDRFELAFWLFLAAALTDVADGYVAKRWARPSSVGAALDPVADKLLVGCLLLALARAELVPAWLVALAIGRDVMLVAGAVALRSRLRQFRIEPLVIGKLSTFLQLVFLGFVLGGAAGVAEVDWAIEPLILAVAVVTLASAAAYLAAGLRLAARASSAT